MFSGPQSARTDQRLPYLTRACEDSCIAHDGMLDMNKNNIKRIFFGSAVILFSCLAGTPYGHAEPLDQIAIERVLNFISALNQIEDLSDITVLTSKGLVIKMGEEKLYKASPHKEAPIAGKSMTVEIFADGRDLPLLGGQMEGEIFWPADENFARVHFGGSINVKEVCLKKGKFSNRFPFGEAILIVGTGPVLEGVFVFPLGKMNGVRFVVSFDTNRCLKSVTWTQRIE